jgi:ATP-dependent Clp protease protease subunit
VFAARAMEQAIRMHKSKVVAHVDGLAASAASFLIMAADEIRMAPGSFLMIHKAWTWIAGNANDLRKEADLLEQIDASLVKTYATRSGQEAEAIAQWMADETWIEADRAVELGLANSVADTKATNAVKWDTSAFKNAPKPDENGTKPGVTGTKPDQTVTNPAEPTPPIPQAVVAEMRAEAEHEDRRRAVLKALIPA